MAPPSRGVTRAEAAVPDHRDPAFLQGLIRGMRCGILAVDRRHRLVLLNEIGAQILDVDEPPAPGTPLGEALPHQPRLVQVMGEAFAMTSLPNRAELDLSPGAAGSRSIGFTLSMIPGEGDEPRGAAIFFKDLTQIEHKAEQERLRDRLAALGQMAASLAHEMRNPLAAIEVTCTLLKRRLGEAGEPREYLEKIAGEVQRLNRTITSSLEFVRPLALRLEPHALTTLLDAAIETAARRVDPGARARIVRRYGRELLPFLMDRTQLQQVVENLVLNALQAAGPGGRIEVVADVVDAPPAGSIPYRPAGGDAGDPWLSFERIAVIRVSDDGAGIAPEDRHRIFYPFYTTKKQGSGVGLSVVRKIVDSHRGMIDVDDSPLGGARFTVRLPMISGPSRTE